MSETDSVATGQCRLHSPDLSGPPGSSADGFKITPDHHIYVDKKPYPITRARKIGYETNQVKFETIPFVLALRGSSFRQSETTIDGR